MQTKLFTNYLKPVVIIIQTLNIGDTDFRFIRMIRWEQIEADGNRYTGRWM